MSDEAGMSVWEKLRLDKYSTELPYPTMRVRVPGDEILNKKVSHLTAEELASVPRIQKELEQANAAQIKMRQEYNADELRLQERWKRDLHDDLGVPQDDPVVLVLFSYAWQESHSAGLHEVSSTFQDLVRTVWAAIQQHYEPKRSRFVELPDPGIFEVLLTVPKAEKKKAAVKKAAAKPKPRAKINPPKRFPPPT